MPETLELNRALVRRVYAEWWNENGNTGSVDEMVQPDFIGHLDNGNIRTINSLRQTIALFQSAFSGLREVVEDMIAEGDRVVVRYTMYGTHTGDFHGIKPTGIAVKVSGIEIFRIDDGKIAEFWHFGDSILLE
ncbi:ester cyclase [Pararhizobium sp. YC-54]|uniref:ester cyclase n=1 Tax=Pararhizobium sp. YC-54 TaxID=2986920 RepID=UPI0021F7B51F|nr:ester cyclase [Pararhizobium sp. YC-54]MCV9999372.1 ester cyclase [Pararhizobium sp. YC-54]